MPDFPGSPDEIIDPRWNTYLRPARGKNATHPAQLGGHEANDDELSAEMRVILEPWQAGEQSAHRTLQALRRLADRAL
jgi:hypothetical protein